DPLRALRQDQLDLARGRARLPRSVHGGRDHGIRSVARLHRPPRRSGWRDMRGGMKRSMMGNTILAAAAIATGAAWSAANGAGPRYPDWPCAQAKVPELSVAAVWAGPPIDAVGETWKNDPKLKELVARLAARRTPLEDAQKAAKDFIAAS